MAQIKRTLTKNEAFEALDSCECLDEKALSALRSMVENDWVVLERDFEDPKLFKLQLTDKGNKGFRGEL